MVHGTPAATGAVATRSMEPSAAGTNLAAVAATDHWLRPAFTASVAKALADGDAINLVAPTGQGAGRLLQDLKALPGSTPRLIANLKTHRRNQAGLVAERLHQCDLPGPEPTDFGALCLRLEQDAPNAALLLHRFDALFREPHLDPAYNDAFINALNALRSHVLLSGEQDLPGSLLDLEHEDLPALMHAEIALEIARLQLPLDAVEAAFLAEALTRHARPMALLDHCTKRLRDGVDGDLPLPARLKR
jgi:hypothetical protein